MPSLNTAEERINAGQERINEAIRSNSTTVDLSNLKLTEKELGPLLSLCRTYANLINLDLSGNQIKALPKGFYQLKKLEAVNLAYNNIKTVPKEIGKLLNLTTLYLENNQLKNIPEEVITLPKLEELSINGNPIVHLPENIASSNLNVLFVDYSQLTTLSDELGRLPYKRRATSRVTNPESEPISYPGERVDHIEISADNTNTPEGRLNINTLAGHININIVPGEIKNLIWTDVFGQYKEDALKKIKALKLTEDRSFFRRLAPVKFNDAKGKKLSATEVLERFVQGLEIQSLGPLMQIYIPALKKYLAPLFDENATIAEKTNILQTLATSLGNCNTPKIDLLTQIYIGQKLNSRPYEMLKLFDQRMIEREAVEVQIRKRLDDWIDNWAEGWKDKNPGLLSSEGRRNLSDKQWKKLNYNWEKFVRERHQLINERNELINGFSNIIYGTHPCEILQEREICKLPSKTYNVEISNKLTKILITPFIEEFCEKDEDGNLVLEEGEYELFDLNHITALVEDFLQSRGHGTEKSKQISDRAAAYEAAIHETMFENGFFDIHDGKPEVNKMLNNIANQRDQLKTILRNAENIEETFEQFLKKDKAAITQLVATLEKQTQSGQTAIPDQLAQLAITQNSNLPNRSNSLKPKLSIDSVHGAKQHRGHSF